MSAFIKIFFLDEGSKTLAVPQNATAAEVVDMIAEKIELHQCISDFKIFEVTSSGEERPLGDEERPNAVQQSWLSLKSKEKPHFLFKRLIFMDPTGETVSDPVLRSLLYYQSRDAVLHGLFVLDEVLVVDLAALLVAHTYGSHNPEKHRPGFLAPQIRQYIPAKLLEQTGQTGKTPAQWEELVLRAHASLSADVNTDDIEEKFLTKVRTLPFYGAALFPAKYLTRGSAHMSAKVFIGVSVHGVHLFDNPKLNRRGFYSYNTILSWGASINSFAMKTDETQEGLSHVFTTDQGNEISNLIQCYVTRILAAISSTM